MDRINPTTEQPLDPIAPHDDATVERSIAAAVRAGSSWADRPLRDRRQRLQGVAEQLRSECEEHAALITSEVGKPITESRSEIEKCAWVCEHYAEHAGSYLAPERLPSEPHATTFVRHEPLGPLLAVMPWNFPFWQVFRFVAPALVAGNTALLKHASNVPGCAQAIERVVSAAGVPDGVFQSLLVGSEAVESLITDDRIKGVTLTGSERAGQAVGGAAGTELLPSVLELGGSDPFIVLADANVEAAARIGARARTINSGQSCIAAKRFIVHEAVYEEFRDRFIEAMAALTVGDPTDESTDVGPQARADLLETLDEQVTATVEAGATLELGGEPLDRTGYFFEPTVLSDVPPETPMTNEEVFGPVAPIFEVDSTDSAIELANDSPYGLGCSLWSTDLDVARELSGRIDAGCVFINELTKSDPRLPFGGIGRSGYGRELSKRGIEAFTNQKTVWIQSAANQ
ncbi:NAD-dependent succinate-semialdehyde dehydrogenase [Halocatena halophila]|uniref:NAD-dependent succinate-semialdehyde dehydrogenase n=1 Tax=Halocatena halophila TaxID=2814576 RepID=UPI002ED620E4